jgi:Flp pilus assembly protein TadD
LVNEHHSWPRLLAVAALTAAFAATARGGFTRSVQDSDIAAQCELHPPGEIATLERCLAMSPRDIELMLQLGTSYEVAGETGRAEAIYRRGLAVDPRDGDLHVRLGRLLLRRGDAAGAALEARTALELQPNSPRARDLLSHATHAGAR